MICWMRPLGKPMLLYQVLLGISPICGARRWRSGSTLEAFIVSPIGWLISHRFAHSWKLLEPLSQVVLETRQIKPKEEVKSIQVVKPHLTLWCCGGGVMHGRSQVAQAFFDFSPLFLADFVVHIEPTNALSPKRYNYRRAFDL